MAIAQNVHRMFWLKDFFCIHIYHFTLNLCMQQLSSKMHLVLRKMFIIRVNANTIKIGDYIQNIWNKTNLHAHKPVTWLFTPQNPVWVSRYPFKSRFIFMAFFFVTQRTYPVGSSTNTCGWCLPLRWCAMWIWWSPPSLSPSTRASSVNAGNHKGQSPLLLLSL